MGQSITPGGNTNQVMLNYGGYKPYRILYVPRTFTPFPAYDSTAAIWLDSAGTKGLWYHNGVARKQLAAKAYVDSIAASITIGGIDTNNIVATIFRDDTGKRRITSAIPTNNNQLTNGAGYITSSSLTPYLQKSDSLLYTTIPRLNHYTDSGFRALNDSMVEVRTELGEVYETIDDTAAAIRSYINGSFIKTETDPMSFHKTDSNTFKNPVTLNYANSHYLTSFTESDPLSYHYADTNGFKQPVTRSYGILNYYPLSGNPSGFLTGNQNITFTGDATGSGSTSVALTIGASKVTNSMLSGSIAASKLVATDITTVGTIGTGTWNATSIGPTFGGTGISAYATGDILYSSATNTLSKLSGNTSATKKFLNQTGTGSVSAAPSWDALVESDLPSTILTTNNAKTVTQKRFQPRTNPASSYTTSVTLDLDNYDGQIITAQTGGLLFNAPTWTAAEMEVRVIRIKDNGTARALTWNSFFRGSANLPLPSTTTLGKVMYLQFIYNATDTKADLIGIADGY